MIETLFTITEKTVALAFDYWPSPVATREQLAQVQLVAHRGNVRGMTENQLAGFQQCAQAGIGSIEFDIRWTMDNIPIVLHDATTLRTYKTDLSPHQHTAQQLQQLLPELPTLKQVVEQVGSCCHFFVECKEELTLEREAILLETLKPLEPEKDFHVLSLDPQLLGQCQKTPKRALVLVSQLNARSVSNFVLEHKWGGVAGHFLLQNDAMIKAHHQAGQKVGVGFMSSFNNLCRQIHRQADWFFSDQAIELQQSLRRHLDHSPG